MDYESGLGLKLTSKVLLSTCADNALQVALKSMSYLPDRLGQERSYYDSSSDEYLG